MIKIDSNQILFTHLDYGYLFISYDSFYYTDIGEYEPILEIDSPNYNIIISSETQQIRIDPYEIK